MFDKKNKEQPDAAANRELEWHCSCRIKTTPTIVKSQLAISSFRQRFAETSMCASARKRVRLV
jgi:hypothetical protein